ncbi:hypothetical protein N0V90_006039 [Kalmusia sp. IMI 367209]|nr:hypothetical protein N0V90_006039 [Kalmusia sp. IMI 367209]
MPHYENEPTVDETVTAGDWRDELFRDGYVVVKGVLSDQKAQSYVDGMFQWLESFPYGFKADDVSKWGEKYLPTHINEPAIIQAFAKLWGTNKLLVSFDGMNLTLPAADMAPSDPWPHVDQSPNRKGMQCVQGILNLAPNGPEDGGLVVLQGSHKLNEEFFKAHPGLKDRPTWGPADWFGFANEEVAWFEQRGCTQRKVCADPGDLILWDSRTIHYNVVPSSRNVRAVMYVCYTPAAFASQDDLEKKATYFHQRLGTTHWPHANIFHQEDKKLRLGKPDTYSRFRPVQEPEESELILRLAGVVAY